jgi:adenylosuccinate synthase
VPPSRLSGVIGVAKAYTTRVGNGPFPTELPPDEAELFRRRGNEYGATTRRPRRCGWFDAVAVAYAAGINGVDKLVVTKLDVLSGMPTLKLCTAYQEDGRVLDRVPASAEILSRSVPVYEEMEGWEEDIAAVRAPEHLPSAALRYLHRIEELADTPLWMVSVGPQRDQFIHF